MRLLSVRTVSLKRRGLSRQVIRVFEVGCMHHELKRDHHDEHNSLVENEQVPVPHKFFDALA